LLLLVVVEHFVLLELVVTVVGLANFSAMAKKEESNDDASEESPLSPSFPLLPWMFVVERFDFSAVAVFVMGVFPFGVEEHFLGVDLAVAVVALVVLAVAVTFGWCFSADFDGGRCLDS